MHFSAAALICAKDQGVLPISANTTIVKKAQWCENSVDLTHLQMGLSEPKSPDHTFRYPEILEDEGKSLQILCACPIHKTY